MKVNLIFQDKIKIHYIYFAAPRLEVEEPVNFETNYEADLLEHMKATVCSSLQYYFDKLIIIF